MNFYIPNRMIIAFGLVLAYDIFEDRRVDDIINIFSYRERMAPWCRRHRTHHNRTPPIAFLVLLFSIVLRQLCLLHHERADRNPCCRVSSVIDHRRRQAVERTSVAHSAIAPFTTFAFLPRL